MMFEQDSSTSSNETMDQVTMHSEIVSVDVSEQGFGSSNETAEDQVSASEKTDDVSVHVSAQECLGEAIEEDQVAESLEKSSIEAAECEVAKSDEDDQIHESEHVAEPDGQFKKTDVEYEPDCDSSNEVAKDEVAKSDLDKSPIEADDVTVHECEQDCSSEAAEDQGAESDDQLEKTDEECEQDCETSNEATEAQVAKSDLEKSDEGDQIQIEKSDDVSVNESDQDCAEAAVEDRVAESVDQFEKTEVEDEEDFEKSPNKAAEEQVTKLEEEKSDEEQVAKLEVEKSDDVSVNESEQDCGEARVVELDTVNEEVNEDPSSKWDKEYPPLPVRSLKVKSKIVPVVTSRKEVSKIESRTPTRETRDVEAVAEPFSFLIKVPRLDGCFQEQVNLAKLQLEEKTKLRDSIQCQIQENKANSQIHRLDCESAKDEVKKLRNLVKSKHKQLHEESDLGNERHLKILTKELQILKEMISTAVASSTEAEKRYNAEDLKTKQLHTNFRAVNDERQAVYVNLQSLKKKLSGKNQPFFRYKDDAVAANSYARSGNKNALHYLCSNEVERTMELWNKNDEFRRDYVKSNARSTIRRLGTLDGRSLGPGEKQPVLPSYPHEKVVDVSMETRKTAIPIDRKLKMPTRSALKKLSEAELTEKAEEMVRKEEAEAKCKEQRRLEELALAEVGREKKLKRQAEKEQREAEEIEKERQRRMRKKEKKKEKKEAVDTDIKNDVMTSAEVSLPPSSMPNRNKKGFRQLILTGLISIFVYILFRLGDADVYSKLSIIR